MSLRVQRDWLQQASLQTQSSGQLKRNATPWTFLGELDCRPCEGRRATAAAVAGGVCVLGFASTARCEGPLRRPPPRLGARSTDMRCDGPESFLGESAHCTPLPLCPRTCAALISATTLARASSAIVCCFSTVLTSATWSSKT